ncbi:hypothetical protein PC111_g10870 [Phytophthora cactorum]|uniref:Uncharacterized protein n=1 Tax=Phytophthora cactorum TaxID=29920 RepID=A0A8T1D5H6_9STRA|nr:hypothetical protein PC111_g10870 [Phytophthora cactorum]KAG2901454.1 hypothetical protein PC114_g13153 [Phytophthora cactorum]KAG2934117.1 hypothetical protein PC117_g12748 [Phytophthora cactorum]KAG3160835.1 hypothetical protein C6341_g13767 [Phytophthora cactorum]KAG4053225.1 hypothetical protein PC123_g11633 [Phytophthora cactorum]
MTALRLCMGQRPVVDDRERQMVNVLAALSDPDWKARRHTPAPSTKVSGAVKATGVSIRIGSQKSARDSGPESGVSCVNRPKGLQIERRTQVTRDQLIASTCLTNAYWCPYVAPAAILRINNETKQAEELYVQGSALDASVALSVGRVDVATNCRHGNTRPS